MNATEETPDVWTCSLTTCNGHRVTSGPISGQRMDEKCLVCTECGDESLVSAEEVN
jgi:hypothetical protein